MKRRRGLVPERFHVRGNRAVLEFYQPGPKNKVCIVPSNSKMYVMFNPRGRGHPESKLNYKQACDEIDRWPYGVQCSVLKRHNAF